MPGAGSLKAAMYLYGVAPKDGSVIATIGRSAPLEPLLGDAQFDGRKFAWLGSIAKNSSLCASWHASAIKTWQDALVKPFALAGEGSGSDPDNFARILKNVFGAKVKLVTGGGTEMNLAIERGEVDGRCGWSWDSIKSTRPDWLRDKKINLLAVFRRRRLPTFPPRCCSSAILPAATSSARSCACTAGQPLGRPFLPRPACPRSQGAARGLRRHHQGSGFRRRDRQGQARDQSDERRGDRPAARRHLRHAARRDREGEAGAAELAGRINRSTTLRIDLPSCIRSNARLMSDSGITWVIMGSISILPCMYQSTILGTSVRRARRRTQCRARPAR